MVKDSNPKELRVLLPVIKVGRRRLTH